MAHVVFVTQRRRGHSLGHLRLLNIELIGDNFRSFDTFRDYCTVLDMPTELDASLMWSLYTQTVRCQDTSREPRWLLLKDIHKILPSLFGYVFNQVASVDALTFVEGNPLRGNREDSQQTHDEGNLTRENKGPKNTFDKGYCTQDQV